MGHSGPSPHRALEEKREAETQAMDEEFQAMVKIQRWTSLPLEVDLFDGLAVLCARAAVPAGMSSLNLAAVLRAALSWMNERPFSELKFGWRGTVTVSYFSLLVINM